MKIEFIKLPSISGNIKATIHVSGKMGFSQSAIETLHITDKSYIKIGINKEEAGDDNLYVAITTTQDEETLKINKAGNYFYINTKALFDKLEIDYRKSVIIYDIIEIEYSGEKLYKFIRREKDRKKSK